MSELQEVENEMLRHDDPVVSCPELAELLDRSDTSVRNDLKLLEREGAVRKKSVGANADAWFHSERVMPPQMPPEEHPQQSALSESVDDRGLQDDDDRGLQDDDDRGLQDETTVDEAVEQLSPPGRSMDVIQDRLEAVEGVLMHLRDGGPASGQELQQIAQEHHESHYESADSFWKNLGQPSLKELREAGFVVYDDDNGVWGWKG